MDSSTKRTLLIGGSLLVVAGVIYYFSTKDTDLSIDEASVPQPNTFPSNGNTLDTIEKVKSFQDWMDTVGPWVKGKDGKYRLLNKGVGYGTFGPSTKAAWNFYKDRYASSSKIV